MFISVKAIDLEINSKYAYAYNVTLDKEMYNGEINENEANLKILDLLLKYNMIDKETIMELYNNDKIRDIKDIETVVLNY